MKIKYFPASAYDADTSFDEHELKLTPQFYAATAQIGMFVSLSEDGALLDRAVLSVDEHGKIAISHRTSPRIPAADKTEETKC